MSEIDWLLAADVFADALEQPLEERSAFVRERCAGQPELLAAVQRMLASEQAAGPEFLRGIDPSFLGTIVSDMAPALERIGPWRLLREIGRGGMGQVFLAQRADGQFEQRVAIKLLKRGMDSDAILARFLRERQILAALDHPNIARLFDGGVAGDGRPYFVLEYVDGQQITAFADAERLSIDARIELFRSVCSAVEYAHRNLIVHRDLKPSNILVTTDGRPKLLDFGIAKLLSAPDEHAAGATLTSASIRLLTPDYAAPEQFRGEMITTSTDVYGLGAVLYELLSGQRPFGAERDRFHERADSEPSSLSVVLQERSDPATGEEIAAARSSDTVRLRRRLAGDLEIIVATALRAAPERRYASVSALEEDLRRHQERLPIRARPDSLAYRVSRFVRRHRVGVLAAAAIVTLLFSFGVTASLQARAVARERDRARQEAAVAQQVSDFLVGVFEVADPMQTGLGDSIRARDLLERGAKQIETELAGQPAIQGRLLGVIGRAYYNLQRRDLAESLLARAAELQRETDDSESSSLVSTLAQLGKVRTELGDYPEAEKALRQAMAILQRTAPDSVAMWGLLLNLAYVFHLKGEHENGRAVEADAIRFFNLSRAESPGGSLAEIRRMADLLERLPPETWEFADVVFERLVAAERSVAGERSVPVAAALSRWATLRTRQGDHGAADSMLDIASSIHAANDPSSLAAANAQHQQSGVAFSRKDLPRADSLARSALRIMIERLGEDHREVAMKRMTLSFILQARGLIEEAIALNRLASQTFERDENDADALVPPNAYDLALMLRRVGRLEESIVAFERALRGFKSNYPPEYLMTAHVRRDFGEVLIDLGRSEEAEPMLQQAVAALAGRWGAHNARVDAVRIPLARALTRLGRRGEAQELLRAVVERLSASRGADDPLTRQARSALDEVER
jgi:serine/threonine-protein kinase